MTGPKEGNNSMPTRYSSQEYLWQNKPTGDHSVATWNPNSLLAIMPVMGLLWVLLLLRSFLKVNHCFTLLRNGWLRKDQVHNIVRQGLIACTLNDSFKCSILEGYCWSPEHLQALTNPEQKNFKVKKCENSIILSNIQWCIWAVSWEDGRKITRTLSELL